jgi:hypothetical protein
MGKIRGGDCGRLCAIAVASCLGVISGGLDRECSTMRTYVRKDEVVCVSGKLKSLRSQLEFFKGELDRALVLVDEGLGSIGLKVAK